VDSLIALDSDGTVFDSMRAKHEGCFGPLFARHFAPGAAQAAHEVWRHVNLGSRSRGINRYRALGQSLRLLPRHPQAGRVDPLWLATANALEAWLATEPSPSRAHLEAQVPRGPLARVLAWTVEVDSAMTALGAFPVFRGALAALPALAAAGDLLVLSAAPEDRLRAEWRRAGLLGFATAIDGQDRGPKAACLASRSAGRTSGGRVLVLGDSPADLEVARGNSAAFFPIIPGREEECWALLLETGLPRFLDGERSPGRGLIADFLRALPAELPWATGGRRPLIRASG
jgi:phosphoglycolate phosphatase-like HAD superfamily hydrolase